MITTTPSLYRHNKLGTPDTIKLDSCTGGRTYTLITDHQHGSRYRAGGVPAERIVTLLVLRVAGPGDDLVALHLALTGRALLALVPVIAQPRAIDLDAADAAFGVGLGAGGGAACKHYHYEYDDKPVHSNPY